MINEIRSHNQGRPYRHSLHRLIVAALVSATVFSLLIGAGEARPYTNGGSQMGFVNACRYNGGVTKRLATYVVECTLPNGYVIVCNFESNICIDYPPAQISATTTSNDLEATATFDWIDRLAAIPPATTTTPPSR